MVKYIFKLSHVTTVTYNAQSGKNAKITQDFSHRQQALFPHIQQNHRIESKKKILWKIINILKNFFAVNLL